MINMSAKFHFNSIYLKNSMEGGPFRQPLALERPKKPSINRVNVFLAVENGHFSVIGVLFKKFETSHKKPNFVRT